MSSNHPTIPDIRLVRRTAGTSEEPVDTEYPWKLVASFEPPRHVVIGYLLIQGGSEELVVTGMTREGIDQLIWAENLTSHTSVVSLILTDPDGNQVELTRESLRS